MIVSCPAWDTKSRFLLTPTVSVVPFLVTSLLGSEVDMGRLQVDKQGYGIDQWRSERIGYRKPPAEVCEGRLKVEGLEACFASRQGGVDLSKKQEGLFLVMMAHGCWGKTLSANAQGIRFSLPEDAETAMEHAGTARHCRLREMSSLCRRDSETAYALESRRVPSVLRLRELVSFVFQQLK